MGRVCILDYGSGNTRSVLNLFSSIAEDVVVSNMSTDIKTASHIVLPGVGAFAAAMRKIRDTLPMDDLEKAVLGEKKPFLGICVGMQVMATQGREFGECEGLGWIPGRVEQLATGVLPLPHVGWNSVASHEPSPLTNGLGDSPDFYFVHSFAFKPERAEHVVATTEYGEQFCSVIRKDNLFGVQFHPEKSQRTGIRLAKNFLALP